MNFIDTLSRDVFMARTLESDFMHCPQDHKMDRSALKQHYLVLKSRTVCEKYILLTPTS